MKKWNNPDVEVLVLSATANGKLKHKNEGIDGVDAHGEYNKYINKNGTGLFTPPTTDSEDPVENNS